MFTLEEIDYWTHHPIGGIIMPRTSRNFDLATYYLREFASLDQNDAVGGFCSQKLIIVGTHPFLHDVATGLGLDQTRSLFSQSSDQN